MQPHAQPFVPAAAAPPALPPPLCSAAPAFAAQPPALPAQPITPQTLAAFAAFLTSRERSPGTVQNYLRAAQAFAGYLAGAPLTREGALGWKASMLAAGCAAATVNARLSALNRLLVFLGRADCRVSLLRVQRRIFRPAQRQLSRREYARLLAAARQRGDGWLSLLLETLCSTGIRVSELCAITAGAVQKGRAEIRLKGKVRVILLPAQLCRRLQSYARRRGIRSGPIFCTRTGAPLGRQQVWRLMKSLCAAAKVPSGKVFPHNLRHLFATAFYAASHDIARLADVLGHSSLETTRIYLATAGEEHRRTINRLRLLC